MNLSKFAQRQPWIFPNLKYVKNLTYKKIKKFDLCKVIKVITLEIFEIFAFLWF